ncbi:MAG: CDP-diacylglycerol--inositol 3-phosphatidyltransferase [bacterium]|nr:CDP-diacylglycerol--inositol 3-phosphatidyltransferase [bacterium]MCK6558805.1 CDP-alcohol phosphatidyltransferase family protein [bacterium]
MKLNILPDGLKNWYLKLITPIVDYFISHHLNPNWFTTIGFALSVGTTYLFAIGELRLAGIAVLLAGTFDIIDGRVARATNRVTKFGALYDSALDRYSEVFMFFGLAYFYVHIDPRALWRPVAVAVALGGSMMVSYIRARAEGLGLECKVGIMQRPERVVSLGFGALIGEQVLTWVIIAIAILANFTAIQRLYHIWAMENGSKSELLTVSQK